MKKKKDTISLVTLPVAVHVHDLDDGELIAVLPRPVCDYLYGKSIQDLQEELAYEPEERLFHVEEKRWASAFYRREMLQEEPETSPVRRSNTYFDVVVSGDISSWKITPLAQEVADGFHKDKLHPVRAMRLPALEMPATSSHKGFGSRGSAEVCG